LTLDLLTLKVVSESHVTCDVGYLCAKFSLPGPLCSRLRPDVRDRQTSDAHHRLMPYPRGGGIINRPVWLRLAGQRPLMCYVIATLMTSDKQSNGRRIEVQVTHAHPLLQ